MMNFRTQAAVLLAVLLTQVSNAQLFSIDINGTVRSDVTAPGFTPWYMSPDITGGKTATRSFTNFVYTYDPDTGLPVSTNIGTIISCTVTMTNPPASDATHYLNANYANKNGNSTSTDPNAGWRLSGDGCWAHWKDDALVVDQPNTNGGALSLTINGLSNGVHTVTTYHNDLWATTIAWHGNRAMSLCVVSANGLPVFTNTPTTVSTNDTKCGFAFFYVTNSFDGQPLVLNFDPDHSSALDFTILNGFEVDRPNPPGTTATAVSPVPGDEHVFANNDVPASGAANAGYLSLKWQPAGFAITNFVYFGTSSNSVYNATTASPEYKGESAAVTGTTNSLSVSNLNSALTYYWRVDQLNVANGATNLVKGYVWNFRTRHLAFPGAEGYGRFARGGRGGRVIEVTNLNDSGPGSYRAAVQASGPRTIVFRVSGLIRLNSPCTIGAANGYVTVAGQTAPGDGICIANWRAGMGSCTDVNMRFMRCRLGDGSKQAMDGIGLGNSSHSIIDHTTISWTMDEATSSRQSGKVGSESAMITFQHNIVSEPLQHSYHYNDAERAATGCTNCYQAHAFAGSISGEIGSYHHNLIAHSTDRNWSLAGGLDQSQHYAGSLDIRNNVVYNWTARTTDGGVARCNYVNNFYRSYSTSPSAKYLLKLDTLVTNWGTESYYMTGNVMTGVSGQADLYTNNWANGGFQNGSSVEVQVRTNSEIFPSFVDTQSASNAYKIVLSDSGCNLPRPDGIDVRAVGEVLDRTIHYIGTNGPTYTIDGVLQDATGPNLPGIIDEETDVRDYSPTNGVPNYSPNWPWPPYYTYNVPVDTDHDGLPDWWEQIKGFNTNSPAGDFSDSNSDPDGDGYSNLEDYLNWLAQPHYDCTNGTPLNVELTQYTRGFTNNTPVYLVFAATSGSVTLSNRTALFNSSVTTNGLGSFKFKVTDASGFAYTNTVNVRLIATNPPAQPAPTFFPVGNQVIDANATLVVTNRASASLSAGERLQFTLLSAPTGARVRSISPTNAIFAWSPHCDQGGTTNLVTIQVAQTNAPFLSATQSFYVVVPDCVQVSMGRSVVQAGNAVTVPVALLSTVTLSNIAVAIDYPAARFTNASWLINTQQVAAVPFFDVTTNGEVDASMDLQTNHALRIPTDTAFLGVVANANQQSAFVPVGVPAVMAWRPDGTRVTNAYGLTGRIVVVGEEPLLEALSAPSNQVALLQYALTGSVMQIESRTSAFSGAWQSLLQNTQTNLMQDSGTLTPAAPALFFRAIRGATGP